MKVFATTVLMCATIFFATGVICQTMNAPNLVPNPGFEHGDNNKPIALGQLEHSDNWKDVNSPDWFRETNGHLYSDYADPHTGTAFVGFSKSEGIQIKLNASISEHSMMTISFWFTPESTNNVELNIFLNDDCYNDNNDNPDLNMETEFHTTVPVISDGVNPLHTPGVWYHYQSEPFLIVSDANPEWLLICGNPPGDSYVYLDDIEVTKFTTCAHTCVLDNGPLTIQTMQNSFLYEEPANASGGTILITPDNNADVITVCVGNTSQNFYMVIKNALRVRFSVWGSTTQIIYLEDSYDYNGLKDDGFEDHAIVWNGNILNGGSLQSGIYNYRVEVWKCNGPRIDIQAHMFVEIYQPPALPTLGSRTNSTIDPCCEDHFIFQNVTFLQNVNDGWNRKDAIDYIRAGENVDAGQPSGEVTVNYNTKVAFYAGNAIDLQLGFVVQPGAEFKAKVSPCGATPRSSHATRSFARTIPDHQVSDLTTLSFAPMPVSNTVRITSTTMMNSLEIYSITGELLIREKCNSQQLEIDLGDFSSGMYVVKAYSVEGIQLRQLMKI